MIFLQLAALRRQTSPPHPRPLSVPASSGMRPGCTPSIWMGRSQAAGAAHIVSTDVSDASPYRHVHPASSAAAFFFPCGGDDPKRRSANGPCRPLERERRLPPRSFASAAISERARVGMRRGVGDGRPPRLQLKNSSAESRRVIRSFTLRSHVIQMWRLFFFFFWHRADVLERF